MERRLPRSRCSPPTPASTTTANTRRGRPVNSGPRYEVRLVFPRHSTGNPEYVVRQHLYPYAEHGPTVYTLRGQPIFELTHFGLPAAGTGCRASSSSACTFPPGPPVASEIPAGSRAEPAVGDRRPCTVSRRHLAFRQASSSRTSEGLTLSIRAGQLRQPPVPAAEDRHHRRHEDRAHDRRVDQDARRERGGEDLDLGARARAQRDEGEAEDQRGARDQPAGAADALDDRRQASTPCGRTPRASG